MLSQLESVALRSFGVYDKPEEDVDVEILFSPAIAWRIEERIWHPEEDKTRLRDGRLVAPASWRDEFRERAVAAHDAHA